ncbi:hypothetical protein [Thermoanaerobacterium sp. RBIITD]|nr:hypothetical protein [Thermoanaerobacterium sp. RBIITD]SNX52990.1 hypothetical protein SAMN05660242_0469 [Thermoanaerobacterium sp. RBIITD]
MNKKIKILILFTLMFAVLTLVISIIPLEDPPALTLNSSSVCNVV